MFKRRESERRFVENQVADYGTDNANTSHAWVALYALNFLNAHLKHDSSAKEFLERTPAANGGPKHFIGTTFRPAGRYLLRSPCDLKITSYATAIHAHRLDDDCSHTDSFPDGLNA